MIDAYSGGHVFGVVALGAALSEEGLDDVVESGIERNLGGVCGLGSPSDSTYGGQSESGESGKTKPGVGHDEFESLLSIV